MSQFLETLKARLVDSQKRLQAAQAKLQQAQIEHQAVMQEFASWQNAVAVETRREEGEAPAVTKAAPINPAISRHILPTPPATMPSKIGDSLINKTSLIRDVLRQNPNGITPANIWRSLKDQVPREYVYSVLKRLKDRKQASERRGKYVLIVEAEPEDESGKGQHAPPVQ